MPGDKGYTSKGNRDYLKKKSLYDGIMFKVAKKKVLTENQKRINKAIRSIRWQIERSFGSIIRWFHGSRCRYRDLKKTRYQNLVKPLAYNLKRSPRLLIQIQK